MSNDDPPIPSARLVRPWVWGCSDESIALGQISVLAVAEVVMAVALYWWLATHFDWPWMAFIGLIAAPILLLRSPESVELGVAMLRRYWNRKEQDISERERVVIILISALATGLAVYCLANLWLPGYAGWAMHWRAAVLGLFAVTAVNTIAFMFFMKLSGERLIPFSFAVVVASAGSIAGAIAVAIPFSVGDAGIYTYGSAAALVSAGAFDQFGTDLIIAPMMALALMLYGLLIRWIATLRYLPSGLAHLPQNWRDNLLVIDLLHPPELLPQAAQVGIEFSGRGILAKMPNLTYRSRILVSILLLSWCLPALAYRWSLKASAWLWWPLALTLSSPLEGLDGKMCREKTSISVGGAWRWLLPVVPAMVFAWLILSALPRLEFLLLMLPEVAAKLAEKLLVLASPPSMGVRYVALWLGCVLALVFWWRTKNLKASHGKVLESPKEFNDLLPEDKERFLQLARPIEKLRLLLIVTVLVLGEAYAISIFHAVNPPLAEKVVASWLFQIL